MKVLVIQDPSHPFPEGIRSMVAKMEELGHEVVYSSLDDLTKSTEAEFDMLIVDKLVSDVNHLLYHK